VRMAHTGQQAVEMARQFRPDVILLDLGLPGWDGFEVARRLKADPELRSAQLVALTGYSGDETVEQARELGFTTHLTKPADLALLREVLSRMSPVERAV